MAARGRAVTRLSRAVLEEVRHDRVQLPPPPGLAEQVGILHLGIGAFHRAHQAVFTEDAALASDEHGWGICGVTQRSAAVVDQLRPQDWPVCRARAWRRATPTVRVVGRSPTCCSPPNEGQRLTARFADPPCGSSR